MIELLTLLKREYWEHRASLLILPLAVTGFLIAAMLVAMIAIESGAENLIVHVDDRDDFGYHGDDNRDNDYESAPEGGLLKEVLVRKLHDLANYSERRKAEIVQNILNYVSKFLFLILWGVIFFYLLASLYQDRKDRSVLFWKSMPVSDVMTVASKLLMATLVAPLIVILCIMILQLGILLAASVFALGENVSLWDTFWRPSSLLILWINLFAGTGLVAFWCLPSFGWLVLVSSFARSIPLAWALGIPIAILVIEKITFSPGWITLWMSRHVFNLDYLMVQVFDQEDLTSRLFSVDMLSALVIGGVMIAGAVWMRGRCEEI